jgi:hypothetical protein
VDEALLLADRVLILADGRITFSGAVDVPRPRDRDRPALIEIRSELLRQLGVTKEGQLWTERHGLPVPVPEAAAACWRSRRRSPR